MSIHTMNTDWQHFLESQGAAIQDGTVVHFGHPEAELKHAASGLIVADLSHLGLIQFAGEDAQGFLQGQLTNDARLISESASQITGYCTPKGRMLATSLMWLVAPQTYLMQLPASVQPAIQKRLSMYVLRSKVKVSDASDTYVRIGVAGAGAEAALHAVAGTVPPADYAVAHWPDGWATRLPGGMFLLLVTPAQAQDVWQRLSAGGKAVGAGVWDWHLIRAGIPQIVPATQEQFVPQMANLDLVGGVNFKKGCYPGQEIVARTQYLGKLKRRMYLAHLADVAAPGTELFSDDFPEQSTGMIVNVAPAPEGGYDALAVVQISSAEAHTLHLNANDGPTLKLGSLPYPLTSA
jgi:tRNA-modifying protein YgfZ